MVKRRSLQLTTPYTRQPGMHEGAASFFIGPSLGQFDGFQQLCSSRGTVNIKSSLQQTLTLTLAFLAVLNNVYLLSKHPQGDMVIDYKEEFEVQCGEKSVFCMYYNSFGNFALKRMKSPQASGIARLK